MSKLQDARIHQARRAAIRNRLIGTGKDPDVAERWCHAWEAGKLWIDAQCAARKRPPS